MFISRSVETCCTYSLTAANRKFHIPVYSTHVSHKARAVRYNAVEDFLVPGRVSTTIHNTFPTVPISRNTGEITRHNHNATISVIQTEV